MSVTGHLNTAGKLPIVLGVFSLFALVTVACFGERGPAREEEEEEAPPSPGVWVIHPSIEADLERWKAPADSDGNATIEFTLSVQLLACNPEVVRRTSEFQYPEEGYEWFDHPSCSESPDRLEQDDIDTLSASGTVVVTFYHIVEVPVPGQFHVPIQYAPDDSQGYSIPPLRFGEKLELDRFTRTYPVPDPPPESLRRPYAIIARVQGCTLSNGTPCGNNQRPFDFDVVPASELDTGTGTQGLAPATSTPQEPGNDAAVGSGSGVTALVPNDSGIVFGSPNEVILDLDAGTGTFRVNWFFQSSPETVFTTTGTITVNRQDNALSGAFSLDDPGANALAYLLGDFGMLTGVIDSGNPGMAIGEMSSPMGSASITFRAELR